MTLSLFAELFRHYHFLAAQPDLISLLTVHSYRFDPDKTHPLEKLLSESNTSGFATNFLEGVKVAHETGVKLRLTEAGSAWGGGIAGLSDTFAAALWTIDVLFEFVTTGLDGVNFHNVGANPYSVIQENRDPVTQAPIITANAPYYGMLLFAEATALRPPLRLWENRLRCALQPSHQFKRSLSNASPLHAFAHGALLIACNTAPNPCAEGRRSGVRLRPCGW